jgi:hypothetical protein
MGLGGGNQKSSSWNKSEFDSWAKQNISPEQQSALSDLWDAGRNFIGQDQSGMNDWFNNRSSIGQAESQGAANNMRQMQGQAQGAWGNQLQGGAYAGQNIAGGLAKSLGESLNNPSAMQDINSMIMGGSGNNYADAMKSQYMQDAGQAQDQMMGNMDARAAAAGMSGGSMHGTAIGRGMEDINRNLQGAMARTGYETFDKDLNRKLGIAQQADQGTLARQGMMMNMLGQKNQTMQNAIGQTGNMQGYAQTPYNMQQQYTNDYSPHTAGQRQMDQLSWAKGLIGPQQVLDSSGSTGSSEGSGRSKGMNFNVGK